MGNDLIGVIGVTFSGNYLYIENDANTDFARYIVNYDTEWHEYIISCISGTVYMYKDGVLQTPADSTITGTFTPEKIGHADSGGYFNGEIDLIGIYNTAFTAEEVYNLYN